MDKTQSLFSQREAAIYLNIDKNTLAKYRKLGYFDTIQLKQTILFSKEDLDTFKEKFLLDKTTKAKTKNLTMDNEIKTAEETLTDKITELESQLDIKRAEFKENLTKESLKEVNALSEEISDYKIRLATEQKMREQYWNEYKNTLSPEDFSRLWEGRLRDEALLAKIEEVQRLKDSIKSTTARWNGWSGI